MTTKAEILKAIRRKCLDCCVGQSAEIKKCPLQRCDLWPYRFGTDPNPSKPRGIANHASAGQNFEKKGARRTAAPGDDGGKGIEGVGHE